MTANHIVRKDILSLRTLNTGAQDKHSIRLNANEAPDSHRASDDSLGLNRYPEVRPSELRARMAQLYGVPSNNLMVTRGSSEGIDVLIRACCRANQDNVLVMPPTFELYRFFAQLQGAAAISAPLYVEEDFSIDTDAVLAACTDNTKLIFICTPNNPTGNIVSHNDIARIADARRNRSIVVVDEAYIEFSGEESVASEVTAHENLVVLRTLSKAYALAGARCGAAIANESTIGVISRVLAPFSFSTPVIDSALNALTAERLASSELCISEIVAERKRLFDELSGLPCIDKVWPSYGNFLLFRLADQASVLDFLKSERILILGYGEQPGLKDCARLTVGSRAENDAFVTALKEYEQAS